MDDLDATDRCVKCGLCLPHCPTFTLTGDEADSPRGRISLMQWLDAAPELSPGLLTHIDRCLQCGACEAMCPSKVPFGALMDTTRTRLVPQRHRGLVNRLLARANASLLASPRALKLSGPLLNGYRRLGLPDLLGKLPGRPGRLNRLLVSNANVKTCSRVEQEYPRIDQEAGAHVHVFPGCTGYSLDRQTLDDTQHVLKALGYDACIAEHTACCGALHQHKGDTEIAASLAKQNRAALDGDDGPVISIASGCAAHLKNYDALAAAGESIPFSPRVSEIMVFLAGQDPAALGFDACPHPVGIHIPCTQRNALGEPAAIVDVLNWIPGLETLPVNPRGGCCGAAGSYMITQPEISDALGHVVAQQIADSGVRTVVTTNIGCSIQLQAQLHAQGTTAEVIHPVTLLRRQLRT